MKSNVTINKKGLENKIKQQKQRIENLEPVMKIIAQDLQTQKDINFKKQQDPYGKAWDRLSESTLNARRNKKKSSAKILQDTGRLRASFTTDTSKNSSKIGTNLKYAPTHQYGAKRGQYGANIQGTSLRTGRRWKVTIPWGDIPSRKMIGINKKMNEKYKKLVLNYVLGR